MNHNFIFTRLVKPSLLLATLLVLGSNFLVSCSNPPSAAVKETPTNNVEPTHNDETANVQTIPRSKTDDKTRNETDAQVKTKSSSPTRSNTNIKTNQAAKTDLPESGTVKKLVQGDIECYVTLTDAKGNEHNLGASFDICAKPDNFLNKKVSLVYQKVAVNDCQSAEPCGKSRQDLLITKMKVLPDKSPSISHKSNTQTISNGDWTITIGNRNSWSGVNGTGNLSYSGCDPQKQCIKLNGGQVNCRDGKCVTAWKNGIYYYILEQPILEEPANPEEVQRLTSLTVKKGSNVILNVSGFKIVDTNS